MNLHKINELVKGTILQECNPVHSYTHSFASDLMSDVLRFHMENSILVTGLCTVQAIRTAEMSNISCIIFARDKKVSAEMLELACENHISIIATPTSLFEIVGLLYTNGIKPVYE
ncbi:MAG: transcriptional regulator [Petrimonas sp.]|nr:transcriptional regulator [Petrimonas sp.]